jgi:hypothetical protein
MRALSLIEFILKFDDARKIITGKLDGAKLDSATGEVSRTDLLLGLLNLQATYEIGGQSHTVKAQRKLLGEGASIEIDGKPMANPDVDIDSSHSIPKTVVKYVLQYEDPLGTPHELELHAHVKHL